MACLLLTWFLTASLAFADEWKSAAPIPKGAEEVGMVMEYDPGTDKWMRKGDMPHSLHYVALAEVKGRIYMFGGFTPGEREAYVGSG